MNENLRFEILPPALIISNYVRGDESCEYELYLRDIINKSHFFMKLSEGEEYCPPHSESRSESDAITELYSIDFKLIESASYLEAKSVLSNRIDLIVPGAFSIAGSKRSGNTTATYLNVLLRGKSIEELEKIESCPVKYIPIFSRTSINMNIQSISDVKYYLKILHTRKNLLMFFPRLFVLPTNKVPEGTEIIGEALENDFGISCLYREKILNEEQWDTFFTCLYDDCFIIFQVINGKFIFVDKVKMTESDTFMHLYTSYGKR